MGIVVHLARLPALTHLCLSTQLSNAILPHIVLECPRLTVIATLLPSAFHAIYYTDRLSVTDQRVVVRIRAIGTYLAEWEAGARGGDDFWVRAERLLARKRKGEIASEFLVSLASSV